MLKWLWSRWKASNWLDDRYVSPGLGLIEALLTPWQLRVNTVHEKGGIKGIQQTESLDENGGMYQQFGAVHYPQFLTFF